MKGKHRIIVRNNRLYSWIEKNRRMILESLEGIEFEEGSE